MPMCLGRRPFSLIRHHPGMIYNAADIINPTLPGLQRYIILKFNIPSMCIPPPPPLLFPSTNSSSAHLTRATVASPPPPISSFKILFFSTFSWRILLCRMTRETAPGPPLQNWTPSSVTVCSTFLSFCGIPPTKDLASCTREGGMGGRGGR